jgi:hypothetical protein
MKRVGIVAGMILFVMVGMAQASLVTIGTATYNGTDYNLIWDDNNNGNSVIWLDYSNAPLRWQEQTEWAAGLDSSLNYNIAAAYSVAWSDAAWRLPETVDGPKVQGYEGDPNNDGVYTYTAGYNLANSEMGHLFYVELGNPGSQNTSGDYVSSGLLYTGDFHNLIETAYWSGTSFTYGDDDAWDFFMSSGYQGTDIPFGTCGDGVVGGYGLAVRTGQVQVNTTVPTPEPATMLLLGFGIISLAGLRRKVKA